jgi:hypothetical protein
MVKAAVPEKSLKHVVNTTFLKLINNAGIIIMHNGKQILKSRTLNSTGQTKWRASI